MLDQYKVIQSEASKLASSATPKANIAIIPVQAQVEEEYIKNVPEKYRADVYTLSSNIKLGDYNTINQFGAEIADASAKFTSKSTQMVKVGESGAVGDKINEMLKQTKSLNTSALIGNENPGFLSKLFGKVKEPIEDFRNKQKTVSESVKQIGDGLLQNKQKLLDENKSLEQMYIQNEENIQLYNVIVAAGMIKCKQIEEELKQIQEVATQTGKQEDLNKYRDGQNFLRQLEIRVNNLNSARSLALLQSPSIRDMQSSNSMQIENIQTMVTVGIPAWEQQIALCLSQLETKKSIETTNMLRNGINSTIQENARLMGQNSVQIAEAANTALIAYETIQTVHNELINSIEKVQEINLKGKQNREEMNNKLLSLETELKTKLLK